jgi:hypothetical protein
MTPTRKEEIRRHLKHVTPGRWVLTQNSANDVNPRDYQIANEEGRPVVNVVLHDGPWLGLSDNDGFFITQAKQDVSELLDYVDELEKKLTDSIPKSRVVKLENRAGISYWTIKQMREDIDNFRKHVYHKNALDIASRMEDEGLIQTSTYIDDNRDEQWISSVYVVRSNTLKGDNGE